MQRTVVSRAWVVAFVWTASTGCQLLSGIDDLTVSGSDGGPSADGPAKTDVAPRTESGADARAETGVDARPDREADAGAETGPDTGMKTDGGLDANVDWCMSQDAGYRICSDFDLPAGSVTQGFDIGLVPVAGGAGGNITLDPSIFLSPPHGALAVAKAYKTDGTGGINLDATLWPSGSTPSSVQCSAAWNPRNVSNVANDYAHVLDMVLFNDTTESMQLVYLGINLNGDGTIVLLEFYPTGKSVSHPIPYTVVTDKWLPLGLSFSPGLAGVTNFKASVDGTSISGTLTTPFPVTSYAIFEIGPAYYAGSNVAPSPGWTFDYDNVICY